MSEQGENSKQEMSNLMATLKGVKDKFEQAKVCQWLHATTL